MMRGGKTLRNNLIRGRYIYEGFFVSSNFVVLLVVEFDSELVVGPIVGLFYR